MALDEQQGFFSARIYLDLSEPLYLVEVVRAGPSLAVWWFALIR